ncbi:hypothetical protein SRABI106_03532 [Rahnella aquatilis]|nr:hypothetical protein SRABI106_03532 [Rahnella aquatilis]
MRRACNNAPVRMWILAIDVSLTMPLVAPALVVVVEVPLSDVEEDVVLVVVATVPDVEVLLLVAR